MPEGFFRGEIDVAFQRSAVAGEVVMLRDVGAEGSEALFAMTGAVDDQIGGVVTIQHAGQGMAALPGVDGEDVVLFPRGEEDGAMSKHVCRVPVFAAAAVGENDRGLVFF